MFHRDLPSRGRIIASVVGSDTKEKSSFRIGIIAEGDIYSAVDAKAPGRPLLPLLKRRSTSHRVSGACRAHRRQSRRRHA
ncbi:MAG TPA: hypothetical protein VEI25_01725, partial [Paraburkholderia sp.]|nr:hypothetical protein [Paraburkholderia sp.]